MEIFETGMISGLKPEQNPKISFSTIFLFIFFSLLFLLSPFFFLPSSLSSPPTPLFTSFFRHCSDPLRPTSRASHPTGPLSASSAPDSRPGARDRPGFQLLVRAKLLPGDLPAQAELSHAKPRHQLAPARPDHAQAELRRSSNVHQARTRRDPGAVQARRRPPPHSQLQLAGLDLRPA